MTELGARARAVLAAVRSADRPRPADRTRIAVQLAARLPIAAMASTAPAASTSAATAATGLAAKALLLSALVGASAFVAGYVVGRSDAPLPPPSAAPTAPRSVPERGHEEKEAPASTALPDPPTPSTAGLEPPAPPPPAARSARATTRLSPSAQVPNRAEAITPPSMGTLAEETVLLGAARAALGRGDSREALAKLEELAERHPAGALREERMATRVMVLCAAGRNEEARAEAERFLQEVPQSLQAARVRASCIAAKP